LPARRRDFILFRFNDLPENIQRMIPFFTEATVIANFIPLLLIVSSVLALVWLGVFSSRPLLSAPQRRNRLTIWHVLLVVWAYLAAEIFGAMLFSPGNLHSPKAWTHWAPLLLDTFARVVVVIVIILIARARFDGGWRGMGISPRRLPGGVLRGAAAYLLLAPVLYLTLAIFYQLNQRLVHHPPPEHPLLKAMQSHPAAGPLLMLIFMACVSAPISEELFFRGLLQSYIAGAVARGRCPKTPPASVTGADFFSGAPRHMDVVAEKIRHEQRHLPGAPEKIPTPPALAETGNSPSPATSPAPVAKGNISPADRWVAILISAAVFSLVHYAVMPGDQAWLPGLFVLGVGLGYIYERTGNIWADITMHSLFNLLAVVIVLAGHVRGPAPTDGHGARPELRLHERYTFVRIKLVTVSARFSSATRIACFSSRLLSSTCPPERLFSPITIRKGMPIRSASLNFTPGRWSRSSTSTSTPRSWSSICSRSAMSLLRPSYLIGVITT
jgi:membrane protease YdiL (CAAX protease family)